MYHQHRGKVIKEAVKKSGYKVVDIIKKLDISRNTLYYKFRNAKVDYDFIVRLGRIINYDFSIDFPELNLYKEPCLDDQDKKDWYDKKVSLAKLEKKYDHLLKKVDSLLDLFSIIDDDKCGKISEDTKMFLKSLNQQHEEDIF